MFCVEVHILLHNKTDGGLMMQQERQEQHEMEEEEEVLERDPLVWANLKQSKDPFFFFLYLVYSLPLVIGVLCLLSFVGGLVYYILFLCGVLS